MGTYRPPEASRPPESQRPRPFSASLAARYTQMIWRSSRTFMRRTSPFWALTLLLVVLPTTGCLFRTRPVEEQYSKAPLLESSQQGLINTLNQQAEKIQSLQATVDIDSSAGG